MELGRCREEEEAGEVEHLVLRLGRQRTLDRSDAAPGEADVGGRAVGQRGSPQQERHAWRLEHLTVDAVRLAAHLVVTGGHRGPERDGLPGDRPTPDAEDHPATSQEVRHREVLGQALRVPLRDDVEHLPLPQALGPQRQHHAELDQVGDHLVALVLEVVLGQPEGVVAEPVGGAGSVEEVVVGRSHVLRPAAPVGGHRPVVAGVRRGHRTEEEDVEPHRCIEVAEIAGAVAAA